MRTFRCDHCQQPVFFENTYCVKCQHRLAFLPDLTALGSLEQTPRGTWRSPLPELQGREYWLCANYNQENVCNWVVPVDEQQMLCRACRLTRVIPDLSQPGHKESWYKLEVAKRRLVYTLMNLGLPLADKNADPERGLAFEFLAELPEAPPVFTGHSNGVITINLIEADDAQREQRRLQLHEPYRTLLGHFRHESGHYYWDRLLQDSPRLPEFRALFGDERADYGAALQRHYDQGAPAYWQNNFISAYATMHPWEDWAETWAHYLHMTDLLETAANCGLVLKPPQPDHPVVQVEPPLGSFDRMINDWFPLTYVLNNLNRSLGLADGYPFVLTPPVIEKLRFIHSVIQT